MTDSLVLNIGDDIGALVIHADAALAETEIEISPDVPAGDYVIWRDATTPDTTVTVRGGQVTERHRT